MEFVRVMAGDPRPKHMEEWVDVFLGGIYGFMNLLVFTDRSCFTNLFETAFAASSLSQTFDEPFPTGFFGIAIKVFSFLNVLFKFYIVWNVCTEERRYKELLDLWMGDHLEESDASEIVIINPEDSIKYEEPVTDVDSIKYEEPVTDVKLDPAPL